MISIIVPIYNAEKTLHRCIDSILSQTYTDFELLLVNDGSTDKSECIISEYQSAIGGKIKTFHKENGGVSSARNLGLDYAQGEWVMFVDADDYIEPHFLSSMVTSACHYNVDLVVGRYLINHTDEIIIPPEKASGFIDNVPLFLTGHINDTLMRVPWGKLFRRSLIGNIMRFNRKMKFGEDTHFMLQFLRLSKFIVYSEPCACTCPNRYVWYGEGGDAFIQKYQQSVQESVYCLKAIMSQYESLQLHSLEFEKFIFVGLCLNVFRQYAQG